MNHSDLILPDNNAYLIDRACRWCGVPFDEFCAVTTYCPNCGEPVDAIKARSLMELARRHRRRIAKCLTGCIVLILAVSLNWTYLCSRWYLWNGKPYSAIDVYSSAIRRGWGTSSVYFSRGALYCSISDFVAAERDFSAAVQLDNRSAQAYFGLAVAKARLLKCQDASDALAKARLLDPIFKAKDVACR